MSHTLSIKWFPVKKKKKKKVALCASEFDCFVSTSKLLPTSLEALFLSSLFLNKINFKKFYIYFAWPLYKHITCNKYFTHISKKKYFMYLNCIKQFN